RIVIDPLTPVLWSMTTKYEQREIVSFLLRETRKIGTVLCTLEEHGGKGDLSSPEIAIPMYLADNVVHIRYTTRESPESRELKIIKTRMSPHSRFSHPYTITQGVGIVVHGEEKNVDEKGADVNVQKLFRGMVEELPKGKFNALKPAERKNISRAVKAMADNPNKVDLEEVMRLVFHEYGLL
ncbi:MAG: circadian clock protein KaiC, partial [Thermoplasmata archaeon]|nr:circadian clock protein KaiC [Thermoplasmata archaeon]